VAGSRAEADAGDRPVVGERDIFEVFADGSGKAEVVVSLYQPLVEFFQGGASHHTDGQRGKPGEGNLTGGIVDLDLRRWLSRSFKPRRDHPRWWKGDVSFRMELEQETPADHVAGCSIGLGPVPETAQLLRYEEPAVVRITSNKFSHVLYIPFAEDPPTVSDAFIHTLLSITGR